MIIKRSLVFFNLLKICFLCGFLLLIPKICFAGFEEWAAEKGFDLATHMDDMLLDLEVDAADLAGLASDKKFKLSFNLLPFTLPPVYPNLSLKARILKENEKRPQISCGINYGEIVGMRFVEDMEGVDKAKCYIFGASLVLSKSLTDKASIFSGIKYMKGECGISFTGEKETEEIAGWLDVGDLPTDIEISDYALFTGFKIKRTETASWSVVNGYIPSAKKIFSKIELSLRKHWVAALGIYPEGVFVLHPMVGLRW